MYNDLPGPTEPEQMDLGPMSYTPRNLDILLTLTKGNTLQH